MNKTDAKTSFWNTLPGVITAVATLITAIGGFLVAVHFQAPAPAPKPTPTPVVTVAPELHPGATLKQRPNGAPRPTPESAPESTLQPVTNPFHDGKYELYTVNGAPQKRGIIMTLRKVNDQFFLADTQTPTAYSWSGELRRSGQGWDLQIREQRGPDIPREGTIMNPGSAWNEVLREGPLLTFKSRIATFVWREQE